MTDAGPSPTGPEADELLAIELAFGLLDRDARAEAERRVRDDADFALLYARWQARALALLEGREERPPERVWTAIARRLPANDAPATLRWWQAATAVAASIAVALGATLALHRAPQPVPVPVVVERPAAAPPLVAVLASPERSDVIAVSYDGARVSALPARLTTDGREAQLWVIPKGGKPVSAGLLQPRGRTSIAPEQRVSALIVPGATLAVSLEPRGGSRTGAPTGPVIVTGTVTRS